MITSISINQIKYVLALDKTGSFSKAAESCFVTQSTLSTMIKKLEQQFELQLFDRKSKPIRLTQEGQILINQLRVIHREFEILQELVEKSNKEFHGSFKIGIIPTLAPFLLPLFLNNLINAYQGVNFIVHEITTNEIVRRLKERDLDIGILSLPIIDKELFQKTLFNEEFLVYDAGGHIQEQKKYVINDIDIARLWLLEESHCLSNQIEKICHLKKMKKTSVNLEFKSGSILSLLELVNMNRGITLLPKLATLNKSLVNEGFVYGIKNPIPAREIGIVTHPNFAKKSLLQVLEKEILIAVKPILKQNKKLNIIKAYS